MILGSPPTLRPRIQEGFAPVRVGNFLPYSRTAVRTGPPPPATSSHTAASRQQRHAPECTRAQKSAAAGRAASRPEPPRPRRILAPRHAVGSSARAPTGWLFCAMRPVGLLALLVLVLLSCLSGARADPCLEHAYAVENYGTCCAHGGYKKEGHQVRAWIDEQWMGMTTAAQPLAQACTHPCTRYNALTAPLGGWLHRGWVHFAVTPPTTACTVCSRCARWRSWRSSRVRTAVCPNPWMHVRAYRSPREREV
eukprot:COSAG01_NODE_9469_length_2437_cov_186.407186_2_plen_252_part_00